MNRLIFIPLFILVLLSLPLQAQQWNLRDCIDYACENNLQIQNAKLVHSIYEENLLQAKAQLFPSVNANSSQSVRFVADNDAAYSGSYALQSAIPIFDGGKTFKNIQLANIEVKVGSLGTEAIKRDIEVAVTHAYLNILYARENVISADNIFQSSKAQFEREKELFDEGSVSLSEYLQLESQLYGDEYKIVVAKAALAENVLKLKQLLELDYRDDFEVCFPEIANEYVLSLVPNVEEVFNRSKDMLPNMKSSRLGIDKAVINEEIVASNALPTISASAYLSSMSLSTSNEKHWKQLNDNMEEGLGISISIPITNNRQVKTARAKAKIQTQQARLSHLNETKELLSTIESLYQEVISSQSRFIAAQNKLAAANQSYNLVNEKFTEGMINPIELLTEKNTFISAQQELLQAKYQALLSMKLLNFYQGQPIEL